ncbi:S41 family peptidase [Kiloniella sp. b19]|uniref:S41 family peptidase n=1 Tax=Kiloniella sp. GXU_MW_B19 TaxID=3141326 RepID=UPI0031CF9F46
MTPFKIFLPDSLRIGLPLLLALFLFGCGTGKYNEDGQFDTAFGSRLFEKSFDLIDAYHIDPPTTRELALAGIENLSTLDPDLESEATDNSILFSYNGEELFILSTPEGNDHGAWARLTSSAIRTIQQQSGDLSRLKNGAIYQAVLDGMMGELDRFSRYSNPEQVESYRQRRDGYEGIGITIITDEQGVRILSVFETGPAFNAGLKPNDLITFIDGQSVEGLGDAEIVRKITGPRGTKVQLTIVRNISQPDEEHFTQYITRRFVHTQTVHLDKRESLAFIRIDNFTSRETFDDLERILESLLETDTSGSEERLEGIVLDLRNNGGGLVSMAVQIADLFLEKGIILDTDGRHERSIEQYKAEKGDILDGLPIVVLVNGNSASASEILVAALKYNHRAVIIGSKSFGKGSVQKPSSLPNGGEMALTWSLFYAPSGQLIHELGISPDICSSRPDFTVQEDWSPEQIRAYLKELRIRHFQGLSKNEEQDCPKSFESSLTDEKLAEVIIGNKELFDAFR